MSGTRGSFGTFVAALATLGLLFVGACDSDGGSFGKIDTALSGDYSVEAWSYDDQSCDGQSGLFLPSSEDHTGKTLVVEVCTEPFFGTEYLRAFVCEDPTSCDERRCADGGMSLSGYMFGEGSDLVGWKGETSTAFQDEGGETCSGILNRMSLKVTASGGLELRTEAFYGIPDLPVDEEDFCELDPIPERADTALCTSLEILETAKP